MSDAPAPEAIIHALREQRNAALNSAAEMYASCLTLQKKNSELESELKALRAKDAKRAAPKSS